MIYILSDGWHDGYSVDVIDGPKVENWHELCISLIDLSVKDLLDENDNFVEVDTSNMTDEEFDKAVMWPPYISMGTIKDKVISKLSNLGYRVLKPDNVIFYGVLSTSNTDSSSMPHADLMYQKDEISTEIICKLESSLHEKTKERLLSYLKTKSIC